MIQQELPDEKTLRIRKAVHAALVFNEATNQHVFDALAVNLVCVLRQYPLGMREAHLDTFYNLVIKSAFAEVLDQDQEVKWKN